MKIECYRVILGGHPRIILARDGERKLLHRRFSQIRDFLEVEDTLAFLSSLMDGSMTVGEEPVGVAMGERYSILMALQAPIDHYGEHWGSGVTWEDSKWLRVNESQGGAAMYAKVYDAERPELFHKSLGHRLVGHNGVLILCPDTQRSMSEPEVGVVINAFGKIVGYVPANDYTRCDIEAENMLYLPQAKTWNGCGSLGEYIVFTDEVLAPETRVGMRIWRSSGELVFEKFRELREMKRALPDLADWLFRYQSFPDGVILATGAAVAPSNLSLRHEDGDRVEVIIDGLAPLMNTISAYDEEAA